MSRIAELVSGKKFQVRLVSGAVLLVLAALVFRAGGPWLFFTMMGVSLVGLFELYRVEQMEREPLGIVGYLGALAYFGLLWNGEGRFCLPVLIAAVKAMVDPKVHIVGWTCSVAGFAPVFMLNGPIREALGINCSNNFLSPYGLAEVTIPRAIALMIMNISGVRPGMEDNAYTGHEARGGVLFGENEEASPWEPYHVEEAGLSREDSALTMVWAHSRDFLGSCTSAVDGLKKMCSPDDKGAFDPGCTYLISPVWAKYLKDAGFNSRKEVTAYITEYARKPFGNAPIRWMADNNHAPKYVPLPLKDPSIICRKFWSDDHLQVFVAGSEANPRSAVMPGSGDHGGPACIKIDLPKDWEQLVKDYPPVKQEFVNY